MDIESLASMESLDAALLKEQARVRELLGYYKKNPQMGVAVTMAENVLKQAENALISNSGTKMFRAYKALQMFQ